MQCVYKTAAASVVDCRASDFGMDPFRASTASGTSDGKHDVCCDARSVHNAVEHLDQNHIRSKESRPALRVECHSHWSCALSDEGIFFYESLIQLPFATVPVVYSRRVRSPLLQ